MPRRRIVPSLVLATTLAALAACFTVACGEPPDKEIQQAQSAIDAAKAAGAAQYAREELTAAEEALKGAGDAVGQRDYRLALSHALDARDRAQNATKQAAARKTTARTDAERALGGAALALQHARARLKAADASHAPPRTLAAARRTITGADEAVQKARTAFTQGDYPAASAAANGATTVLQAVARDLDAAGPSTVRRRH